MKPDAIRDTTRRCSRYLRRGERLKKWNWRGLAIPSKRFQYPLPRERIDRDGRLKRELKVIISGEKTSRGPCHYL